MITLLETIANKETSTKSELRNQDHWLLIFVGPHYLLHGWKFKSASTILEKGTQELVEQLLNCICEILRRYSRPVV